MNEQPLRYVCLTFDDGPSSYTAKILDILKTYQIRATFFIVGEEAKKFPDIIERISAEGHVIGNHTWSHPNITLLSKHELQREIHTASEQIEQIIHITPDLFRPPFGNIDDRASSIIKEMGMTTVLWNVAGKDWVQNMNAEALCQHIIARLKRHSIILLHDGDQHGSGPRHNTVEALPSIIEYLINNQYSFITVPEFYQQAFKIEKWNIWYLLRLLSDFFPIHF
ncbi:polysaccharide deacetylase family protein [Metabacillus sp. KIGAM252]|uniref:Polysaccharide deacetylase family protein n=1 Tax=Metabacillus flavus TaxID=2823519 RepID=A0ABS5L9T9_9BACI|nr:polysaccharide deacetylase family protein [Metabacillus flavus]MBS2967490.1 polysaccharide deacetylase family protein [Metabacillus flavus]